MRRQPLHSKRGAAWSSPWQSGDRSPCSGLRHAKVVLESITGNVHRNRLACRDARSGLTKASGASSNTHHPPELAVYATRSVALPCRWTSPRYELTGGLPESVSVKGINTWMVPRQRHQQRDHEARSTACSGNRLHSSGRPGLRAEARMQQPDCAAWHYYRTSQRRAQPDQRQSRLQECVLARLCQLIRPQSRWYSIRTHAGRPRSSAPILSTQTTRIRPVWSAQQPADADPEASPQQAMLVTLDGSKT